ncbi:MAG: WS/DGAT/MGAT family O-acyltransferase [Oceanococcus sp.]
MSSKRLSPMDAMFLYGESRDIKMHVAGLLPITPPADAGEEYLREIMDEIKTDMAVQAPWNMKLKTPNFMLNPLHQWVEDENFDIEYHVRRSALPAPGDERELGVLISRLHSNSLDFSRPPWELHLIEGLEGGRLALYMKIHHALVDGYTGMKMLSRSMARDADDKDMPLFFAQKQPQRDPSSRAHAAADMSAVWGSVVSQFDSVKDVGKALWRLSRNAKGEMGDLVNSLQAPQCILNGRIGRNRRFATQQYQLDELKGLAKASGGTLNDIVMALCAGGLRTFLSDMDALPDKPLVAFLPVNVRPKDDPGGGNAVGAMLASLATDIADPMERLQAIIASTSQAKKQMESMSAAAIMAYSSLIMAPFGLQTIKALTGIKGRLPLTFNVCISNVPGPQDALYFRGSKIDATFPVSIPTHGMALNITCQSYNGTLNFGFIGCRDTLPHLQRLAVATGEAMEELRQQLL